MNYRGATNDELSHSALAAHALCYNTRMRVALNGYFWDKPRTGSGQYLRHLWSEFADLIPEKPGATDGKIDEAILLMPPGSAARDASSAAPHLQAITASSRNPLAGRSANLDKLVWEEWGITQASKRQHARLLHSPYLTAPIIKRAPTVVTAHDMIPWVVPGYMGSPVVRLYLALATAGVRRADLVIADSDTSRRDILRVLKVKPDKVHTVYLGVEKPPDYSSEQLDEVRARFDLPTRFAFYIGGFDRRKNVLLLLRAWKAALPSLGDEAVLAIGGALPKPGGVFPDVRREVRKLGLDGDKGPVRFLGQVAEEDKPLLMAAACLFVYPSMYEGFGLDPLEAMSVGCPVISAVGGSLVEVVGNAGLLVPSNSDEALAKAIVRVWQDNSLQADLCRRGKARAATFTWRRTAEQTYDLYLLALDNSKRRTAQ